MKVTILDERNGELKSFKFPIYDEPTMKEFKDIAEHDGELTSDEYVLELSSNFDELNGIATILQSTIHNRPEFLNIVLNLLNDYSTSHIIKVFPYIKFLNEVGYYELMEKAAGIENASTIIKNHFNYETFSQELESSFETRIDYYYQPNTFERINLIAILPRTDTLQPYGIKFDLNKEYQL